MEMHVTVSVKPGHPGAVELVPLESLFASAGRGWCALICILRA